MRKVIRLTESDLARIVKRIIKENKSRKEVLEEWFDIWVKLRRISPLFGLPDHFSLERFQYLTFANVDFYVSEDGESLKLNDFYKDPYNWRDDYQDGVEVLEKIEKKLGNYIRESDLGLGFRTDSNFNMEIYKK
jgi:hypothetical protein